MIDKLNFIIVSFFYIGSIKKLQGTAASLFLCIMWYLFILVANPPFLFQIFILISVLLSAYFSIEKYQKGSNENDPPEIVIDEVCGMMISLMCMNVEKGVVFFNYNDILYLLVAFLIFRVLDALKPSFIYRVQLNNSNLSILLDDVLCGIITLIIMLSLKMNFIL